MIDGIVEGLGDRGFGVVAGQGAGGRDNVVSHRSAVGGDVVDRLRAGQLVASAGSAPRGPERPGAARPRARQGEAGLGETFDRCGAGDRPTALAPTGGTTR